MRVGKRREKEENLYTYSCSSCNRVLYLRRDWEEKPLGKMKLPEMKSPSRIAKAAGFWGWRSWLWHVLSPALQNLLCTPFHREIDLCDNQKHDLCVTIWWSGRNGLVWVYLQPGIDVWCDDFITSPPVFHIFKLRNGWCHIQKYYRSLWFRSVAACDSKPQR